MVLIQVNNHDVRIGSNHDGVRTGSDSVRIGK